jgi:hypothetical protein
MFPDSNLIGNPRIHLEIKLNHRMDETNFKSRTRSLRSRNELRERIEISISRSAGTTTHFGRGERIGRRQMH